MQCFCRSLARFHHRRHLLPLQLVDSVGWNAGAHRYRRSLLYFASLLIRSRVEGEEEKEVGTQSRAASEGGEFLTRAGSGVRQ